jgi:hypothetical protein
MRRAILLAAVLVAASSVPLNVSAADPLADFMQQHGSGQRSLTPEEWCEMALLTMASRYTNEQTRIAISEMARNRGCYEAPQAQPSVDEQARVAVCRTIPSLLSLPGMSNAQTLSVMKIAKDNGCIR